jgi:hypothetical protein
MQQRVVSGDFPSKCRRDGLQKGRVERVGRRDIVEIHNALLVLTPGRQLVGLQFCCLLHVLRSHAVVY